ncbi:hypothetical protein [Streptomyces sp. NPDC000618]|uniref:hypothetical protein n=1 Tax=Streptomyces sp. NPDC000618 TaxID=3154265 RepID=UPI003330C497
MTKPAVDSERPYVTPAERCVPVPRSISPEAQRKPAEPADMPRTSFPDARDEAGWRAGVAAQIERERSVLPPDSAQSTAPAYGVDLTVGHVGHVPVHEAMTHSAFFGGAPEEAEVGAEVKAFLQQRLRPGKEADHA